MTDIFEVVNAASISFAIFAGLAVGYLAIGKYASDPAYASGQASPTEYGLLVAGLAAAVGAVFFGFQILGAIVDGDQLWPRIASRLIIWFLYSMAIGMGTSIRLERHVRRKRDEAHAGAIRELNDRSGS